MALGGVRHSKFGFAAVASQYGRRNSEDKSVSKVRY